MKLNNKLIYQVFIRNYKEGNFKALEQDLERIKELGVDYIYLLPIHPIGHQARKGTLGSPYAITDYYAINPELGSMEDFETLVHEIHENGMRVMMDIVINHSAPDHPFAKSHPAYYFKKPDGNFGNQVGDWTDIIDFDYHNQDLWDEMITMLKYWAQKGVDGFRCDVASFLPIEFWKKAKAEVAKINPNVIWLAESIHKEFVDYRRKEGTIALSDGELYQAFDICYDYDIHTEFMKAIKEGDLQAYLHMLNLQEMIYPVNYMKLHFLENHDQDRIHALTKGNVQKTKQWLAYSFFVKGVTFLYNGQEYLATHTPNLFDKDPIYFGEMKHDFTKLIPKLKMIKDAVSEFDAIKYTVEEHCNYIHITYAKDGQMMEGFFNVNLVDTHAFTQLEDGVYRNLIDETKVEVKDGKITLTDQPMIITNL